MKTAVEWLVIELEMNILWTDKARKAVQKAKEMEKQQISELLAKLDSDIAKELTFKPKQDD
jgi:mRNA-degrading endonuclease RelE of RelBE toxin-antitoxin system